MDYFFKCTFVQCCSRLIMHFKTNFWELSCNLNIYLKSGFYSLFFTVWKGTETNKNVKLARIAINS